MIFFSAGVVSVEEIEASKQDLKDDIILYLKQYGEKGATYAELQVNSTFYSLSPVSFISHIVNMMMLFWTMKYH